MLGNRLKPPMWQVDSLGPIDSANCQEILEIIRKMVSASQAQRCMCFFHDVSRRQCAMYIEDQGKYIEVFKLYIIYIYNMFFCYFKMILYVHIILPELAVSCQWSPYCISCISLISIVILFTVITNATYYTFFVMCALIMSYPLYIYILYYIIYIRQGR